MQEPTDTSISIPKWPEPGRRLSLSNNHHKAKERKFLREKLNSENRYVHSRSTQVTYLWSRSNFRGAG